MAQIMKYVILISICVIGYCRRRCPKSCACHSSWLRGTTSVVVDCSKRGFTTIPVYRVPRDITAFVLNDNYITELREDSFKKYRYLRELYLYKNFITRIDKRAFHGLRRLQELSLHSNQLTEIENGTFIPLRNLKRLYLFTNFIKTINPKTFEGLRQVETMFLHENLLRYIPEGSFLPLEQLRVLTLYRNHLQTLYTRSLFGLRHVSQLYLHQNKLTSIEKNAFEDCGHLLKLQLGNNLLHSISKECFSGLQRLNELYLDNNQLESISRSFFQEMRGLRKLVLLGNWIKSIEDKAFMNLDGMHVLSLSGNHLVRLEPGMFTGLIGLKQLFLQENRIEWIEPNTFEGLRSLQQLYLFRNNLYYIEAKTFNGMFYLVELNLGVNNISGLANNAFSGLPRLLVLQLNSNRLTSIPSGAFNKLRNLVRLVIYFNRVSFIGLNAFADLQQLNSIVWYPPLALVRNSQKLRSLKSNNLYCDCNVRWLKEWLLNRNMKSPIFCENPQYLKGLNVTEVENKFLKCDSIQAHVQPQIAVTLPNSNIEFQCIVNIIANFTWLLNGRLLASENFTFQTTSGSLLLRKITKSLEGQITCVASSNMGIFAASADLIIGVPPKINKFEEVVTVTHFDDTQILTCNATGKPFPLHVWYKNGQLVINGKNNKYFGLDGSLILSSFGETDLGIYRCVVKNDHGMDEKFISVRYKKEASPCQGQCGEGLVCLRRYVCGCSTVDKQCYSNYTDSGSRYQTEEGSGGINDDEDGDTDEFIQAKGRDYDLLKT